MDLEVLEKMSVNAVAEDLKLQLRKLEQQHAKELKAWEMQIQQVHSYVHECMCMHMYRSIRKKSTSIGRTRLA